MTVTTTNNRVNEQGNGVKAAFDFSFKVFAAGDIQVFKVTRATGAATLQTINVDYTVTLVNNGDGGGTVTYTVAPTAAQDSLIVRTLTIDQQFDIPVASNLPEVQLENAYDKLTMIDQQLQEQIDRTVVLPVSSLLSNLEFPTPVANKALLWNATATALINSTDNFNDIVTNATTQATNAANSASSASSSASAASNSASAASSSASAASTSASAAAASAAGVNLPDIESGDADKLLQVNAGETGYELENFDDLLNINGRTDTVITASDEILFGDVSDSNKVKKDTVQGILDLVGGGGLVFLSTQVASSSANISFTSGIDSTYATYLITVSDMRPANDSRDLEMVISTNGGSSYVTTSSYKNAQINAISGTTTAQIDQSTIATNIRINDGNHSLGNASGETSSATILMFNPSGSNNTNFLYRLSGYAASGELLVVNGGGSYNATTAVDAVRFELNAGNIASGRFTLYGVVHS